MVATVAVQGRELAAVDHSSLLYTLVSGEEVVEGPLDPSAYAQTDAPGMGGNRLAVADPGLGFDITFSDPEVSFSATLGGNVAKAPLSPVELDPSEVAQEQPRATEASQIYTVQDGDTIASIAEQFDITDDTILSANGLNKRSVLRVGDHLTILAQSGVLHSVRSGDTVLGIAQKYDVAADEIVSANSMEDSHKLSIGQKLIIPGATQIEAAPSIAPRSTQLASGPTPQPLKTSALGMIRPVGGYISQRYGVGGHSGVDIAGNKGATIYAATGGTVTNSGWVGAYGNMVAVDNSSTVTIYAHMSKMFVTPGQAVAKGDALGIVGSTGRSSGHHLHFEVIRKGSGRINPCTQVQC